MAKNDIPGRGFSASGAAEETHAWQTHEARKQKQCGGAKSCAGRRKVAGEALTGAQAGRILSCEIYVVRGADAVP